jgi:hypothetical protein
MPMSNREKVFLCCLGALAPILINFLNFDIRTTFATFSVLSFASYFVRILFLCAVACLALYLNADNKNMRYRVTFFQLGIAAPAIINSLINAAASNINQIHAYNTLPSFISSALAQPASDTPPPGADQALDCTVAPPLTAKQQVFQGLLGVLPANRWAVVVASFTTSASAVTDAEHINASHDGKYHAEVCQPVAGGAPYYRVVVGKYLTLDDAKALQAQAKADGFSAGTWLWLPLGNGPTPQRSD